MISINHFSLRIGVFSLKDIHTKIFQNEIFAILGKTGSGKTLLLEAIAGFYRGESGGIYLQGTNVLDIPPEERDVGFVYQDYALFPHMSVYKNIYYGLKMHKKSQVESHDIIMRIAETLGITHILHHYPQTLSGGEAQRTALARALVLNPDILLMDEPFSALDPNTKEEMYELIERISEIFKCTVIFVTHDFNEAKRLAKRIGIMVEGELRVVCKSHELFETHEDKEVVAFLGMHR